MKTVLITGATSGIGKAAALEMAQMGWKVIIHGRSEAISGATVNEIIGLTGNKEVYSVVADLSDIPAVHEMANEIKLKFPELRVVINNAGTFRRARKTSAQGIEFTFAVNYLSRFVLNLQLLDVLKQNSPSRIVDVSGAYHARGEIHFRDINLEQGYTMARANSQSKLANVLHTYELARRMEGTGVSINTIHPGAVNTGSILKSDEFSSFSKFMYKLMGVFFITPQQAARKLIFVATCPQLDSFNGKYFMGAKKAKSSKQSYDEVLQQQLWELSEKLVNLSIPNEN